MSKTLEENTWSKILFFDAWTYFTKVKKIHAFYFVCIFFWSQDVEDYGIELEKIHLSTEVSQT